MIGRDRRNATPIVDPCFQKPRKVFVTEIRRNLNIHFSAKNQARHRCGPKKVVQFWLTTLGKAGFGLSAKVLNDDLLEMTVTIVKLFKRKE